MEHDSPEDWDRDTVLRVARRAIHDLAEPLRGVQAVLRHVRAPDVAPDEREDLLEMADTAAARADDILAGLRRVVAALEDPVDLRPVPVAPLLRDVWQRIGGAPANLSIETDLIVQADPAALGQCLSEVLTNVRRHGGDTARVTGRQQAGRGVLTVHDDGPGLTQDEAKAVFAPFHRLRPKSEVEGAGLGLTVARALIRRMGGDLCLRPGLDGGADLVLSLLLSA
mgnify:CR=1 FL=1